MKGLYMCVPFLLCTYAHPRLSGLQTLSPVFDSGSGIIVQHLLSLSGVSVDPWFST